MPSAAVAQQRLDAGGALLPIPAAEQVGMVEQVIQVVELNPLEVALRQGPFLVVGLKESLGESSE